MRYYSSKDMFVHCGSKHKLYRFLHQESVQFFFLIQKSKVVNGISKYSFNGNANLIHASSCSDLAKTPPKAFCKFTLAEYASSLHRQNCWLFLPFTQVSPFFNNSINAGYNSLGAATVWIFRVWECFRESNITL